MKIHASQLERGAGAHAGLVGPFSILEFPERGDSDVAYTESVGGMIYLEKERVVRTCAEAFDRMRAAALSLPLQLSSSSRCSKSSHEQYVT